MLPPIVIDAPPGEPTDLVVEACTAAAGDGQCVPAEQAPEERPRAVAIIRPVGEGSFTIHIELGFSSGSAPAVWVRRDLSFSASDPVGERWRSAGLVVATLAGRAEAGQSLEPELGELSPPAQEPPPPEPAPSAAAPPEPPPPPPPEEEAPAAPEVAAVVDTPATATVEWPWLIAPRPLSSQFAFLGVGAVLGAGFQEGTTRQGLGGRAGGPLLGPLGWVVGGEYCWQDSAAASLQVTWVRASAGLEYRVLLGSHTVASAAVQAGAQRLAVEARSGSRRDTQADWQPVAEASVGLWWQAIPLGGIWLRGALSTPWAESRAIDARDQSVLGSAGAVDLTGALGVGWSL